MFFRRNARLLIRLLSILLMITLAACGETSHQSQAEEQPVLRERPQVTNGDSERGKALIESYGCGSCHVIPGIREADGNVGPPLQNWADRQYIAGALPNTPDNLIHWIRFPQAVEPGTVMPNLEVEEQEARDMAAYLYTLTEATQFTDVFSTPRAVIGGWFSSSNESQGEVPNTGPQQEDDSGGQQMIQQGEQVFSSNCAQCHGQNGQGQVGPALAGNQFVTSQDAAQVIDTVLHGRGQMPAFQDQLTNEQIAAVISFIRNSWGNNASTVFPDQIGGRGQQGGQQQGGHNEQSGEEENQQQSQTPPTQASNQQKNAQTGQETTPTTTINQGGQAPQPNQTQEQAGSSPAPQHVILVELFEWGIDLSDTMLPAEPVLFHITNVGTKPHRFTVEGQAMEMSFPTELQVGQTRTLLIDLQHGTYRIFCPLEDHENRGMSLEFTASEAGQPSLPGAQQEQLTPTPAPEVTSSPGQQTGQSEQQQTTTPSPSGGEQGQRLIQQGEQVFSSNCAQCHGQNGQGQVGPALAGNQFVTSQDAAQVINTVLHGRGQMPAFQDQLTNEQLAAVISFIRNSWGNNASTVFPDQIGGQGQSGQSGQPQSDQNQGQQITPTPSTGDQNQPGGQGQSGGQGNQQGQVGASQQQVTIDLSIQNRAFNKNNISVPAGTRVTVNLTNQDNVPHNFAVYQDSSANRAVFVGQIINGPDQTVTYEFTAPATPGSYYFQCDVHPFMNGEIQVK